MPARLLPIYLGDHLAGATLGVELVRRAARENAGTELGTFLRETLQPELVEDRRTLRELMRKLGVRPAPGKLAAAWLAEKAGRLKLNGETVRYSPLSRLVELEGLAFAIEAKRALWLALAEVCDLDLRLREVDVDALARRAQSQRERLEPYRLRAAAAAFRP